MARKFKIYLFLLITLSTCHVLGFAMNKRVQRLKDEQKTCSTLVTLNSTDDCDYFRNNNEYTWKRSLGST